MKGAMLVDEIHDILRPRTTAITATLDTEDEATEAFTSVSSLVPVIFVVVPAANFVGTLHIEILRGETWHSWQPLAEVTTGLRADGSPIFVIETPFLQIPEGAQIRAILSSVDAGSVDVTIFQGRVA